MIHYQLQCGRGHGFDGWFPGSDAFDRQAARGLVECPVCADTAVQRALMAPALARHGAGRASGPHAEAAPPQAASDMAVSGERLPDHVRAALQRIRAEVERHCDYVGPDFAEEARRIHRGETPHRAIYGETTSDQAEQLAEDGIEVARIPWVPRADG